MYFAVLDDRELRSRTLLWLEKGAERDPAGFVVEWIHFLSSDADVRTKRFSLEVAERFPVGPQIASWMGDLPIPGLETEMLRALRRLKIADAVSPQLLRIYSRYGDRVLAAEAMATLIAGYGEDWLDVQDVIDALVPTDRATRDIVAEAIGALGAAGEPALPVLARWLARDDSACIAVVDALASIGDAAVPVLVKGLTHNYGAVRHKAAAALTDMGAAGAREMPKVLEALLDDSHTTLGTAAAVYRCAQKLAPYAIDALAEIAASPGVPTRAVAAVLLAEAGKRAPVDAVARAVSIPSTADAALKVVTEADDPSLAIPELREVLRTARSSTRIHETAAILRRISITDSGVIDTLVERAGDPTFGYAAVVCLAKIGKPALQALLSLARDEGRPRRIRREAARGCAEIDVNSVAATQALVSLLASNYALLVRDALLIATRYQCANEQVKRIAGDLASSSEDAVVRKLAIRLLDGS